MYTIINMVIKTRRNISGGGKRTRKRLVGGKMFGNVAPKIPKVPKNLFDSGVVPVKNPNEAMDYIIRRFKVYMEEILDPPKKGRTSDEHGKKLAEHIKKFADFKRKAINLLVLLDPEFIRKIDPEKFGLSRYDDKKPEYRIIHKLSDAINAQVESTLNIGNLVELGDNSYLNQDDNKLKNILDNLGKEALAEYGLTEADLANKDEAEKRKAIWTAVKEDYKGRFSTEWRYGASARKIATNLRADLKQDAVPPKVVQPVVQATVVAPPEGTELLVPGSSFAEQG